MAIPPNYIFKNKNPYFATYLKECEKSAVGVLLEVFVKDPLAKLKVALRATDVVCEDEVESEQDECSEELSEVILPLVRPKDLGETSLLHVKNVIGITQFNSRITFRGHPLPLTVR